MIKIEGVSFRYDDERDEEKYALKDIDLEIKKGEFVCIIGQNGSGKSTLSKLINAIYPPTSGRVLVGGFDTAKEENIWNIRQKAGMVFQNPDNQMVASIVEEDVAFGAENLGVPSEEIRRRVDEALKMVGMYDYRHRSPEQLSGGQKQRVAIAGILAMRPECIVFDESTAMLDPSGRREVMEVIERLRSLGMTVLLVTHHMDEAVLADRVYVMADGRVVMSGSPREVFSMPQELRRLRLDIPFSVFASLELGKNGADIGICLTPAELCEGIKNVLRCGRPGGLCAGTERIFGNSAEEDSSSGADRHPVSYPEKVCSSIGGFLADEADNIITIKKMSHIYDENSVAAFTAISDIDLRVKKGELLGVIGHTGSGKSTLIQHINGLLVPTSGDVIVDGFSISEHLSERGSGKKKKRITRKELRERHQKVLEIRKRVGLVFQYPEYQLFEETVEKDIMFGPLNLGFSEEEARERAKNSMAIVGLDYDALRARSPFDLSGGQKRRVAIAGVLAMEPDILILDEPTAGLDPMGRDEILGEIRRMHDVHGKTVIVVSHSMDDMASIADRIVVMSKGRIALDGSPVDVFAERELLFSVGLDIPEVSKILHLLKSEGIPVDSSVIDEAGGIRELRRALMGCGGFK